MTEITSLGEIAKVISGQSPPGSTYNDQGEGLPFFQGKAEFGLVSPNIKKWCSQPVKIAEAGDILISVRAPVGPTNLADQQCCIGRGLAAIRPDTSKADRDYIHWALKWAEPKLIQKGQGSTFSAINRKDLQSIELPLPPLPEQRRIVDILSRANGIRRLRREAQEKARQVIPALFVEMFGDPQRNPKGWPVDQLTNVAIFVGGSSLPDGEEFIGQADGTLLLKVSDLNLPGNETAVNKSKLWTGDQLSGQFFCEAEAVVFPKRGAAIATNKKRLLMRDAALDPNLMAVRPEPAKMDGIYLLSWFNSFDLASIQSGTVVPQINKRDLAPLTISVPPVELQKAFGEKVSDIQAMIAQQDRMAAASERLVQSLMAEVFG